MGACSSSCNADFRVVVSTGDRRGMPIKSNVKISLTDTRGETSSEFKLMKPCFKDFYAGTTHTFYLTLPPDCPALQGIKKICVWREDDVFDASWYVNVIHVKHLKLGTEHHFPMFRCIVPKKRFLVREFDTALPQADEDKEPRAELLKYKRKKYIISSRRTGIPEIEAMPEDAATGFMDKFEIEKEISNALVQTKMLYVTVPTWGSLAQYREMFNSKIIMPLGVKQWRSDPHFARQRTYGCSTGLLRLCSGIPDKFNVTNEMVASSLGGMALADAVERRRIFIVDLCILKDIPVKSGHHLCAPMALFFETDNKKLIPIAIQLEQDCKNSPVFLPGDPEYTWLAAKMWFNNADATYHQCVSHIAYTHLVMEGIAVSLNRQVSISHPMYKLLAPHLLHVIAVNQLILKPLISKGGWFDKVMPLSSEGMTELMKKGLSKWRLDVEGTFPEHMSSRGLTKNALADCPMRDDGILIYEVIHNYVSKVVNFYYSPKKVCQDVEIQAWGKEIVADKATGGLGLKGIPGNGEFSTPEELITVFTAIIHTSSVIHAAVSNQIYEEYSFVPNYPMVLRGKPPKTKAALSEKDLCDFLPEKATCVEILGVSRLQTSALLKPLGDFEINYAYDPPHTHILKEFRDELVRAGKTIESRNKTRNPMYTTLHPRNIPNRIKL